VAAGVSHVDEVAVLRAQLAAAEAHTGVLGAQLAQAVAATSGLVKLEPKDKMVAARASPAPKSSQAPAAPASTGTRSRSSSLSSSSSSRASVAPQASALPYAETDTRAFDGGADITRHRSCSTRYRRYLP
jgi:hypothetical protein